MELTYSLFFYVSKLWQLWKLNCEAVASLNSLSSQNTFFCSWKNEGTRLLSHPNQGPFLVIIIWQHFLSISWFGGIRPFTLSSFFPAYFIIFTFLAYYPFHRHIYLLSLYSSLFFVCYILLPFGHFVYLLEFFPYIFFFLIRLTEKELCCCFPYWCMWPFFHWLDNWMFLFLICVFMSFVHVSAGLLDHFLNNLSCYECWFFIWNMLISLSFTFAYMRSFAVVYLGLLL